MNTLSHYKNQVIPQLMTEFNLSNHHSVPKITKVVINVGLKEASHDKGTLEKTLEQITAISGQKPQVTTAKLSIAGFKIRQGDPVGVAVTLRGQRMYDFLTKLITIALPRVRDFQGISTTAFDRSGNYTLGLSEQIVFPEIDYAKIDKIRGLEITLVIRPSDAKISRRLLELIGFPFTKNG